MNTSMCKAFKMSTHRLLNQNINTHASKNRSLFKIEAVLDFLTKVPLFSNVCFLIIVEPFTCGDNCLSCLGFPDKSWKVNIAVTGA